MSILDTIKDKLPDISLPDINIPLPAFEFNTNWIIAGVVILVVIAALVKRNKDKKDNKSGGGSSSGGGKYTRNWVYVGDFKTEPNEAFDTALALGMMKAKYGTPRFCVGTWSKHGDPVGYFKHLSNLAGMANNVIGEVQGANEIVKWAHKAAAEGEKLKIAVGGEFTPIAEAVRRDPSIAGKIEVFGLGSVNISGSRGKPHYDKLVRHGVKMSGWDIPDRGAREYLHWIRQAKDGDAWIRKHMYPTKMGYFAAKDKMDRRISNEDGARQHNVGQARINSALRVADASTIIALFEGWGKAGDLQYALDIAARGLATFPKR